MLQTLRFKKRLSHPTIVSPEWRELQKNLRKAKRIIDLGCCTNPYPRSIVAVDAFLEPSQRALGTGNSINNDTFRNKGVHFVQADLNALPFEDKEFDFAYSHHVFERLPDTRKACMEITRIGNAGAIITPSVFSEFAFGRPYHLWFIFARENTLIFVRKTEREDRRFGEHPVPKKGGGYRVTQDTNPFDILLNDGGWYHGQESMPRLAHLLRKYWYSHSPVMEVVFLWEQNFNCIVVQEGA